MKFNTLTINQQQHQDQKLTFKEQKVQINIYFQKKILIKKGMQEALDDPNCPVGSIYWKDYAVKFSKLVENFQGGNVIFTEPQQPIKCGGAPQKIMYLTEHRFRNKGIRKRCHIEFQKCPAVVFGVPKYSEALTKLIAEKDITLKLKSKLIEIKPKERIAVFEDQDTKQLTERQFDLLHVVPPQKAPNYIQESDLGDASGFCDVDKYTFIHKKYKNVWSIGDSSNLPTSKTAAAVMSQTPVLAQNILHMWRDNQSESSLPRKYQGYTSCPIFTGDYKLILAEFKYDAVVDETFYSNQDKPHYAFYLLKKYFFPFAYWNFVPRGIWYGRQGILPHFSNHLTGIF
ncbi:hypothetical protein IMG5_150610 [Ichthyophthirius multifiliis]|uniref:Sulfide:quinone oxidoreductase, mitochondrial n=1 Tax=Ichthyophthirius multifiliis TaxID=5932 RepID=G0QYL8_ICHMU|nr:hypothetical protein IMG5_150610 [Ichthyophthirius multifiliis]EGR29692.1 hypothetical protein IMG5_150610 [Ichthyophthirius multifiliis]|eukprot:XP_004030928.1 hypothetical protein IMG5_150610 [Ichthyophthirius multifiliis]